MKYVIYTACLIEEFGWKMRDFPKRFIRWDARGSFDEVANLADQNGTWQIWLETENEVEACTEMARIKTTLPGLTTVFKSNFTGYIGYKETAFKLEAFEDGAEYPDEWELLDWHAEGFEHLPEDEGDKE